MVTDKVNYIQNRKAEIAENEKKAKQTLRKKFRIKQLYAERLMHNANTSYYPKSTGYPACLSGNVIIRFFEDSAQTKTSPVLMETQYNKPEQVRQNLMFINEALYSNEIYYRNNYQLIDSIVKTDSKGLRSKILFKYEKKRFSIVSVDEKSTMGSNIFYLDKRYRCIRNEAFNGAGDLVSSSAFIYDKHGRITEETNETRIIKYEYKDEQDLIYTAMRLYDKESGELQTETLQLQDKNQFINIVKNKGRVLSKTILMTTPDGCVKTVFCYNGENKITQVYEYIFQH
jgi:hypothetical protein